MKIILTKHCKQRRNHYEVKEDSEILPWVEYFINKFKFKTLKNNIYSIKYKGNFIILNKESHKIVVITFKFNQTLWEEKDSINFKLTDLSQRNETKLWRKNFVNRTVCCGSLKFNKNGSVRLKLRKNVFEKYNVNIDKDYNYHKGYLFSSLEELMNEDFISKDKGKYIINFERKKIKEQKEGELK